jgi:hypothetical protein
MLTTDSMLSLPLYSMDPIVPSVSSVSPLPPSLSLLLPFNILSLLSLSVISSRYLYIYLCIPIASGTTQEEVISYISSSDVFVKL